MWRGQSVSVVLPTYRESRSIGPVVAALIDTGVVDEIVVVDNNAEEGTSGAVEQAASRGKVSVRIVQETRQGYGWSCRKGLEEAQGDLVILMEPDGTYVSGDILKLLAYSEFQVVFGTRNCAAVLSPGCQMTLIFRVGNWGIAKFLQLLFGGPNITDVGCTMRLVHHRVLRQVLPKLRVGGSHFSPEMMAWLIKSLPPRSIIEIPVNFKSRVGESAGASNYWEATKIACRMLATIVRVRVSVR